MLSTCYGGCLGNDDSIECVMFFSMRAKYLCDSLWTVELQDLLVQHIATEKPSLQTSKPVSYHIEKLHRQFEGQ